MIAASLYRFCFSNRKIIFFISLGCLLISCKKETASCHQTLKIRNRTSANVTYAIIGTYDSKCFITTRSIIRPTEIIEDKRNDCWEDLLEENDFEYQIMETSSTPLGTSVLCDSSGSGPKLLGKYVLTKSDLPSLQQNNFLVNYFNQ